MKRSVKRGVGFGVTSGIITTLGMIIGLNALTETKMVVIGGILTLAIADALSDAFGVHMSEESSSKTATSINVWQATIATFLSKLIFALTFLAPFLFLELKSAVIASIIWGILLITSFSYYVAKKTNRSVTGSIIEHLVITIIVIVATNYVGTAVANISG